MLIILPMARMCAYPGDPDIDSNLNKRDAPQPIHDGLTWVHTTSQYLYDTDSGDLEEGDYAVQPSGAYIENPLPFVSSTSTESISTSAQQQMPAATSTIVTNTAFSTGLDGPIVPSDASSPSTTIPTSDSVAATST
jgi:hypothetical protein